MSYTAEEMNDLAKKIRYDLTAAQAKLSDLMQMIADSSLPLERSSFTCPICGPMWSIKNERQLAEHLEHVHERFAEASDSPTTLATQ